MYFPVNTIGDVLLISFDTTVLVVTLANTWGVLREMKPSREFHAKTLTQVFVEQSK